MEKHGLASMNKCEENLQISVLQTPKPSVELALILPQDFSSHQTPICILPNRYLHFTKI